MLSIILRTLIVYALLTVSLKIMGKRQLGELDIGELVTTLLISEVAAIPIDDPDIPLLNAILPILVLFSIEIIISSLKNKSDKMKRIIEGVPSYIIYDGKLSQSALIQNRLSINEFLSQMRQMGIGDISEISYAVLEQDGRMSVFKKGDSVSHALIIDGVVQTNNLKRLGYNEEWLTKELSKQKVHKSDIFLMTVNDSGDVYILRKDRKCKNEG